MNTKELLPVASERRRKKPKITAYKAFDKNMQCRGFQFEVGHTYKHDGQVEICKSGFHSCENPLDVWSYYPLDSRYAVVELDGDIDRHAYDSKIAAGQIIISKEITLSQIICDGIAYLMGLCKDASSGDDSKLATSGDGSQITSSGYASKLAASGDESQLASSGDDSQLVASGDESQLAASGFANQLATSGNRSKLAASGYGSQLAASGRDSQLASSGYGSKLASSGDDSQLTASGDDSQLASSGYSNHLATSGNSSQLAASGYGSQLAASGDDSVCVAASPGATARAGACGAIALTYHDGKRFRIAVAYVGENGIEPNVDYYVNNGEFVRVGEF